MGVDAMDKSKWLLIAVMVVLMAGCGDDLEVDDPLSGVVQDREWEFSDGHTLPVENDEEKVDIILSDGSMLSCEDVEDDGTYVAVRVPPEVGVYDDAQVDFFFVDGFDFGFSATWDTVEITRIEDSVIFGELEVSMESTDKENDVSGEFAAHLCNG